VRQPYQDILNLMTQNLRWQHDRRFADPCPTIHEQTDSCSCVVQPRWWDENGTPRFAVHHPSLCADIGASEVALVKIACQACLQVFEVQMSWGMRRAAEHAAFGHGQHGGSPAIHVVTELSDFVEARTLHYGDPPYHEHARCTRSRSCAAARVRR